MSTVEEIEHAVTRLPPPEYARLRGWLKQYDNQVWDDEMARDAAAGRMDEFGAEALADLRAGRCTRL